MLLEVVLEADERCPRCARLEKLLKRLCDDLNIPFTIKYIGGTRSVAAYEESVSFKTFNPEWVEAHGLPEHKKSLEKIKPVLRYIQRTGAQVFPNVIVRWHDGMRIKEIVVRGFDPSDEDASRKYLSNLYALLGTLKQVVRRR